MKSSTQQLHAAADIALAIEQAMRDTGLWHTDVPAPAAMASRMPFCTDTLSFTQWLQFVFLPRIRLLIERDEPLPGTSAIAVMAEQTLADQPRASEIIAPLKAFDALIENG